MIPFTPKLVIACAGVGTGLIVGGIVLLRSLFLFVTVQGRSMLPTLQPQDHVLVLRVRAAENIKKGAIVLLDASPVPSRQMRSTDSLIKRVVAVAGETYTDPGGRFIRRSRDEPLTLQEARSWHIPPGMVFVCGDNLAASADSRLWGPVPLSAIQGVVMYHFKRQAGLSVSAAPGEEQETRVFANR